MMIGGGLLPNNEAIFEKLIHCAGGVEDSRFVILPTASVSLDAGQNLVKELGLYGIPPGHVKILDVFEHNASIATRDPKILDEVRGATAVFMTGGDQRRLVRLLTNSDGSDTPLLQEIRKVYERRGLIAGTSAGASAQSETMLAVSGLPDMLVDEGLDTLDFGLTSDERQRGLLITRGLGFFQQGIIDQHFLQFRGRLGRLTRATADRGVPFGFGIDKNSAMVVEPDGNISIVGGYVLIVEPGQAVGRDGSFGYQISDVNISLLSDGDTFSPQTKKIRVSPGKSPLKDNDLAFNGNFLLNDIGSGFAVTSALISGLAENLRPVQEGVCLKFHDATFHGYRFVFRQGLSTEAYLDDTQNMSWYSLLNVHMDISPIATGLKPAESQIPVDLQDGPTKEILSAIAFRGILTTNEQLEFRPDDSITRAEFASALARSIHLNASLPNSVDVADVDVTTANGEEISRVIGAGFMSLAKDKHFEPQKKVVPAEARTALIRLASLNRTAPDAALEQFIDENLPNDTGEVSRAVVGQLLHRILRLPN